MNNVYRPEIRLAIVDTLKGKTNVGDNVIPNRVRPIQRHDFPAILVYFKEESAQWDKDLPFERIGVVYCEILAIESSDLDDELDAIALQVEEALGKDYTLGDKVNEMRYAGMPTYDKDTTGGIEIGSMVLQYDVQYMTRTPSGFIIT